MVFRWFNRNRLIKSKYYDDRICCPLCRKKSCDNPRIIYGVRLEQCAICLEENPKDIVSLSCGHCFCHKCTKTMKYNTCIQSNSNDQTNFIQSLTRQIYIDEQSDDGIDRSSFRYHLVGF